MESISEYIIGLSALVLLYKLYSYKKKQRHIAYIQHYTFPKKITTTLITRYPHLSSSDSELVLEALRKFFILSYEGRLKSIAMPSQVVDVAWHEFILFTQLYAKFCHKAFGKFYHHVPSEAMKSQTKAQEGIKRIWRLSAKDEGISVENPRKLPLLFAIDERLNIEDGFLYSIDCTNRANGSYCVSHISDSSSNCGGGCSSCTASSCGGGCGGGD
jgi:hypothetical protein